jgi:hypothetical protein
MMQNVGRRETNQPTPGRSAIDGASRLSDPTYMSSGAGQTLEQDCRLSRSSANELSATVARYQFAPTEVVSANSLTFPPKYAK